MRNQRRPREGWNTDKKNELLPTFRPRAARTATLRAPLRGEQQPQRQPPLLCPHTVEATAHRANLRRERPPPHAPPLPCHHTEGGRHHAGASLFPHSPWNPSSHQASQRTQFGTCTPSVACPFQHSCAIVTCGHPSSPRETYYPVQFLITIRESILNSVGRRGPHPLPNMSSFPEPPVQSVSSTLSSSTTRLPIHHQERAGGR